jgi:hypothetical protein
MIILHRGEALACDAHSGLSRRNRGPGQDDWITWAPSSRKHVSHILETVEGEGVYKKARKRDASTQTEIRAARYLYFFAE